MTTKPGVVATEVPLSFPERRRFPRYRYSAPMIVRAANVAEARGMTVEISECGASVIVGAEGGRYGRTGAGGWRHSLSGGAARIGETLRFRVSQPEFGAGGENQGNVQNAAAVSLQNSGPLAAVNLRIIRTAGRSGVKLGGVCRDDCRFRAKTVLKTRSRK